MNPETWTNVTQDSTLQLNMDAQLNGGDVWNLTRQQNSRTQGVIWRTCKVVQTV